jgi:anti-sigma factor RsiW
MKHYSTQENELRRYLLGDLTLEERLAVEERLFLDVEYLQLLRAAEDELLDEYVYDELAAGERERLETHFLPEPGRPSDLRFAKALRRYVSSEAEPVGRPSDVPADSEVADPTPARDVTWLSYLFRRRPVLVFSFAGLLLILFGGLIWFATESVLRRGATPTDQAREQSPQPPESAERQPEPSGNTRTNVNAPGEGRQSHEGQSPTPVEEGRRTQEQAGRRPRQTPGPSPQDAPGLGRTLALLLPPGSVVREDGETNNLNIAADISVVILQLALVERDDYRSYHVSLLSGKQTVYTQAGLKSAVVGGVKVVPLKVPARLLRRQSYQVRLSGLTPEGRVQEIASYSFRVSEK